MGDELTGAQFDTRAPRAAALVADALDRGDLVLETLCSDLEPVHA